MEREDLRADKKSPPKENVASEARAVEHKIVVVGNQQPALEVSNARPLVFPALTKRAEASPSTAVSCRLAQGGLLSCCLPNHVDRRSFSYIADCVGDGRHTCSVRQKPVFAVTTLPARGVSGELQRWSGGISG